MLNAALRTVDDLTPSDRAAWLWLVESFPEFDSPYFRPEFTELVASVRDDVRVVVFSYEDRPCGFFPFQQQGRIGRPIGGRLSDFHGVIISPDIPWSVSELLLQCGVRSLYFDHLLALQSAFSPYHFLVGESPYLDLSLGFDAYEQERRRAGASYVKQALRKERKLHREHKVRFEPCADDDAFERLLLWKSEQYRRTGLTDVFSFDWTVKLLRRLRAINTPGFAGELAALYVDGEPIAVHLGMRSEKVLHYWFPAFGDGWERYSPGLVLLLKIARQAADSGIVRFDLGKGQELYKRHFGSGSIAVAEGVVEKSAVVRMTRRGWRRTKRWLKESPLAIASQTPASRLWRMVAEWSDFQ